MLLKALDRKLLREMKRLKGQIVTIALVLAGGIACFISLRGTFPSRSSAPARWEFAACSGFLTTRMC